jgi:segregation and condensation protein A
VAYEVHTAVFEGPFDLLLHLILDQKVDLFDVRIADIVDAYVAELGHLARLELDVATEFLLIAATLVELKARRLLPDLDDPDLDDELGLWEERDLLLARLLECRTFKDVALGFERRMDLAARSAPRSVGPDERFADLPVPDGLDGVTPARLRDLARAALFVPPAPRVDLGHVTVVRTTVVEAMAEVVTELRRTGRVTYRQLVAGLGERVEMVVRFLAVLELVKQGLVEVDQSAGNFGSIVVTWSDEAPRGLGTADLVTVDAYDG